ncbi:hypothetical protein PoB_005435000 [Plakobranchus ocellatus]|uniref:Secreted protein n=1 Tax=Plakobranchus ocellatus TaxID=259542 RepID=A0AAV4C833_9GAST|nr:hypothetical protein PoB_005435000 [Plakobranchus ocellatus]
MTVLILTATAVIIAIATVTSSDTCLALPLLSGNGRQIHEFPLQHSANFISRPILRVAFVLWGQKNTVLSIDKNDNWSSYLCFVCRSSVSIAVLSELICPAKGELSSTSASI